MLMSLPAEALPEKPAVYIPDTLSNYHAPTLDKIWNKLFFLTIKVDSIPTYSNPFDPDDPCPILMTDDSDVEFWFRDGQGNPLVPDWFYGNFSISDGGWVELPVDDSGYAMYNSEGYRYQMGGGWDWYGPREPFTQRQFEWPAAPSWHARSHFIAGKTYPDGTSVVLSFANTGMILSADYIMKDMDYFRLPAEGAETSVTYRTKYYYVITDEGTPYEDRTCYLYDLALHEKRQTNDYHISYVCTKYPQGSPYREIRTSWRDIKKHNLFSYTIAYAVTDDDVYVISYYPQDKRGWEPDIAKTGFFFRNNQLIARAACTEQHPLDMYWYNDKARRVPASAGLVPFAWFETSPRVLK